MIWLGVAAAGALGALSRYAVSLAAIRWLGVGFPYGTLIVNLAGCFCLGFLAELAIDDPRLSSAAKTIVGTGFLGAFTTFSTFGVEAYRAMEAGDWGIAFGYVSANLFGGLLLVAAGFAMARWMGGV